MIAMMMMMICSGAGLRVSRGSPIRVERSGALVLFLFLVCCAKNAFCVCPHCKDFIPGCAGGDACITITGPAQNTDLMAVPQLSHVPTIGSLIPPELLAAFNRHVVEAVVGIACAPKAGTTVDLGGDDYQTASAVVRALVFGHCTRDDAIIELSSRIDNVEAVMDLQKLTSALDLVKAHPTVSYAGTGQGVLTFVWAKIGQAMTNIQAGVVKILPTSTAGKSSGTSTDLTVTIRRPQSDTEFYYWIFQFQRVLHALGVASFFLSSHFFDKVVWDTIRRLKETYSLAHELMLVYFAKIERDTTGTLNLGNVHDQGSGDVLMAEARSNEAAFFRTRGGTPQDEGKPVKFNGIVTADSGSGVAPAQRDCSAWCRAVGQR